MKILKLISVLVLVALNQVSYSSECWITENYKGYTAKSRDGFTFVKDGMTLTKYVIVIDGKSSGVIGSDIKNYLQTAENSILALDVNEQGSVIETWSVFPESKKALYTKTTNGYHGFDGVLSFVGDVIGTCKSEMEIH